MEETTQTEQGQGSENTATETIAAESGAMSTEASAESGATQSAEYAPNFKYKVYDEEKEFDEFVRPIVTNKEMEEKVRDLYTRAYGLDGLKQKHERLRAEYEELTPIKQRYNNLSESLGALSHYANNGDFDSFFQTLRIPEDKIYKWVAGKLQEQEMSPEQKADLQARRAEQQRLYMLEKQNMDAMARLETFETQQNRMQLESTLARPEYSSVAQAFDARVGRQGAFMEEVIKRGVTLYHITGQDLPPEQVVQDLMQTIGKVVTPMAESPQGMQSQNMGQARPPVIPNIHSSSASPVKKTPRSIDDIRKLAATMS